MTSPIHAISTPDGRYYTIPGYEDIAFRSVTNAVGIMSKPALMKAYANRAAHRAVDYSLTVASIEMVEGTDAAVKWIASAMPEYAAQAAALGSAVHFACEHYREHVIELDGYEVAFDDWLTDSLVPYAGKMGKPEAKAIEHIRKHVIQYRRALDEQGITILDRERTVFSVKWAYAGTLDAIVRVRDNNYVMDIKTGGIYGDSLSLQLAAYRHAPRMVTSGTTCEREVAIHGGCALQLKPRSYKFHFVRCDNVAFEHFLAAMRLCEWRATEDLIGPHWEAHDWRDAV